MDLEHVRDLFEPWAPVAVRRMFGGLGIYRDGLMVALVAGDVLYFRTDAETIGRFEAAGGCPFTYANAGRTVVLPYSTAPDVVFEDPDELATWAELASQAARRVAMAKASKPRRPRSGHR